jgi:hypothetical protein
MERAKQKKIDPDYTLYRVQIDRLDLCGLINAPFFSLENFKKSRKLEIEQKLPKIL